MDHELSLTSIHHRVLDPTLAKRWTTRSPDSIRLGPASARVQSFSARFTRPYPKGAQVACVTCTPLRFAARVRCTCSARAIGASASPLSPSPLLLRRRVFLLLFLLLCCVFNYIPPASINFLGQLRSDRRALARSRRGFAGAEQSRIVCRKNKKIEDREPARLHSPSMVCTGARQRLRSNAMTQCPRSQTQLD